MKKHTWLFRIAVLGIFFLSMAFSSSAQTQPQVQRVYGSPCVGSQQVFALMGGSCSSVNWYAYPTGSATIVSQSTSSVTVIWNSVTSGAYVVAAYSGCSGSVWSGSSYSPTFSVSSSATPSVSISGSNAFCAGTSVTYTATPVNGGTSPYYNWRVNGTTVSSGTSRTFTTSTLNNGDVVNVVMSSNASCITSSSATSNSITVSVNTPTTISVSVADPGPICNGQNGSFVATTSGPGPFTFSWYRNGAPVTGVSGPPPYVFVSATPLNNGDKISCRVSSTAGCVTPSVATSNEVTVSVRQPTTPGIGINPSTIYICEGDNITFTASSNLSMSNFQWRLNGLAVGTNSATYTTNQFVSGSTVTLTASVSGSCLTSNTASASTQGIPFVFTQIPTPSVSPSGAKKICSNCSQSISASPTGTGYTYQWLKDGVAISGGTANPYSANAAGIYTVQVSKNGCIKTSSNSLNLTKNVKPIVNAGADKTIILPTVTSTFTGTASDPDGTTIATVSWTQISGPSATLTGTNSFNLSVKGTTSGQYVFRFTATDGFGEAAYDDVILNIQVPANNYNYIRETTVLTRNAKTAVAVDALTIDNKSVSTEYFDGLARTMQHVQMQASPLKKDIVTPVIYDGLGREYRKYLPVPSTESNGYFKNPSSLLAANGNYANNYYGDTRPFSETVFEPSPLNRPTQEYGPGQHWFSNGKAEALAYKTNVDGTAEGQEKIILWTINATGLPIRLLNASNAPVYYASGELHIKSIKDEHGNETREYIDKRGRLVLKKAYVSGSKTDVNNSANWAQTYYVYDIFDNLRFIFQPELSKTLAASTTLNPTATDLNNYAFQFTYDAGRKLIIKQVPGSDPVYLVYDNRNRLVLTQDGNQRKDASGNITKKEWTFTKYDELNRPIITGLYTHAGTETTQSAMQAYVNTQITSGNLFYEDYNGDAAYHGYTNRVFPKTGTTIYTVTYYDKYNFKTLIGNTAYNYAPGELTGQESSEFLRVTGQVTGMKVNILQSSNYLWTVNYYDEQYRRIQTVSQNHKNGLDRVTNVYDVAKLLETKTSHTRGTAAHIVKNRYEYDHAHRVTKVWHTLNSDPAVLLAQNDHNELGDLTAKKLHSRNNGSSFAQKTDFQYNIRGWMSSINDVDAPEAGDLFSLKLNYNTPTTFGGAAQFNGNISEALWSGAGSEKQSYAYTYDNLNRLVTARYNNHYRPLINGRFNEQVGDPANNIQGYDLNGNIKKMMRNGKTNATAFGAMDNLTYTYTGNRLTKVEDAIATNVNEGGFKNGTNTDSDYTFDWNGNAIKDSNKGVTSITYNHLNRPVRINKSATEYVIYTYDANGNKISQQLFGSTPRTTDYMGNFIYENDALRVILHDEGRIVPDASAGAPRPWEYQYFLKDHLENVRVVFSEKKTNSSILATMERSPASIETAENSAFQNMNNLKKVNATLYNRTPGTGKSYSYRLSGASGEVTGPAKSFAVNAGDAFDLEVYAKYTSPTTNPSSVNTLLSSLIGAFSLSPTGTGIDGQQALNAFNSLFNAGAYIGRVPSFEDNAAPKAFLNYILFDENFSLVDFGFDQISNAANQVGATPVVPHDYLNLHVKVKQKGYLYVYLSNENPTLVDVYFDDFKITYNTLVEQTNDYYPFGLTFNSFQRTGSIPNNFQYNGNELQDELNLGWLDYGARMYESSIARWMVIDPLADKFQDVSPYAYAFNNPIVFVDPEGESPISMLAKQALKMGLKKAAKEMVESMIKKRLANYMSKKWARQLGDDALAAIDLATSQAWWEYAIEFVPVAGDIYGGARLTEQGLKVWKVVERFEKRAEAIANTVDKVGSLRKALKLTDETFQAHHIIPTELLKKNSVVQDAVAAGFKFNDEVNGIAIKALKDGGQHASHPSYTANVLARIERWAKKNPDYTPEQAKAFITKLSKELKDLLERESVQGGTKVNELIF